MSLTIKKSLKNGVNSIKENFQDVATSIKSLKKTSISNKSLKNSVEKSVKNSIKSVSNISEKISNNNNLSYLGLFVIVALTIGYFVNKHFNAIIFLYLIAAISYLLTKKLFYSLLISIIFTNFLLSINFFMDNKEGLNKDKNKAKKTNKNKTKDNKDKTKKELNNLQENIRNFLK